jgi:hypothetical protein
MGRTVRWDFDLKGINARIDNLQASGGQSQVTLFGNMAWQEA